MSTTQAQKQAPAANASELRQAIWKPSRLYAQAIRLSLVIGILILAPSWYMFEVYGRVLNSRSESTLGWLLLAALGIYIVLEVLEVVRQRVLRRAAQVVGRELEERVYNASFHARLNKLPGGGSQPLQDVRALQDFIHSPAVTGFLDLPSSLLCLLLLYVMNVWVGALATVVALGLLLVGVLLHQRSSVPHAQALAASNESLARAYGVMRNAQVIEAMGMHGSMFKRWLKSQQRYITRIAMASDSAGALNTSTKILMLLNASLLLGLACWMALRNELLGGMTMVIIASILGGRVAQPMTQLAGQWRQIGGIQQALERLGNLLASIKPPEAGMELPAPTGLLTAENLQVTPPGSATPVLRDVSFYARPGELLTVIGPSAAGKSSLAKVLVGLWPSAGGKVRLDSADVYSWPKSQLGPYIGYLAQDVELLDGTVAENIARFGRVDMEQVRAVADRVGITAAIEQLPEGFDTPLGDGGHVLSGGQRQRLGLARAIYGNPKLLVLDEPNSSLDEAGERELMQLVMELRAAGTTLIAITHRRALLQAADRLLFMRDGTVASFGTRDEVLGQLQQMAQQASANRPLTEQRTIAVQPKAPAGA